MQVLCCALNPLWMTLHHSEEVVASITKQTSDDSSLVTVVDDESILTEERSFYPTDLAATASRNMHLLVLLDRDAVPTSEPDP